MHPLPMWVHHLQYSSDESARLCGSLSYGRVLNE
jgi:hypothetical protein